MHMLQVTLVRNLISTITIQWVKVAFKLIKFTLENICSLRKSLMKKSLGILES